MYLQALMYNYQAALPTRVGSLLADKSSEVSFILALVSIVKHLT